MIEPGIEPMYVRRWPRISDSSRTPPTDRRTNFRPSAFAIEWPSDVLPTPGGPTKQRICPETSLRSFATARYSMIRSFTFSRSKWSASSTSRACSRSRLSSVNFVHGSVRIHSRYVRMTPYSAAADGSFSSRDELAVGRLAHLLRQLAERLELLAQLRDLGLLGVALAELLLDRLQLLAQEVLALAAIHLRLHLRLDLRPELEHLELAREDRRDGAQPLLDVDLFEDLLPFLRLDRAERRGDEVAERARVVDVRGGELQLLGQVRREPDDAREQALHVARERFELRRLLEHVRQLAELAEQVRLGVEACVELHAVEPLHEDPERPVGDLDHLVDERDGADVVDVVPAGRVERAVARRDEHEQALAGDDVVDQPHRALLADREWRHRLREDDHLLERQNRQRNRVLELQLVGLFEREISQFARTVIR